MQKLAKIFTNKLIQWEIIKNEDYDLYHYGFWQGGIFVLNMLTVVIVGLLFQMLWQAIVFTIAYGLLRTSAGGYHARTQGSCYIFSIAMIIIVLSILKYLHWNPVIYLSFVLLASIFIFLLAPVEDSNKPLDAIEQRVYQKRSRVILVFLLLITFLFAFIGKTDIAHCLSISIIAVAIMVVLGKIKSQ